MLTKLAQAKEKWGGFNTTIDNWFEERKQLLVQYCQLAGLPPFERTDALPRKADIEAFCEILMDYISAGHFEIYEKILDDTDDIALAEKILPKFSDSTDAALSFNDEFASIDENDELNSFDNALAHLGQQLEDRFGYEDELINTLVRSE
ncbi:sigma D regulator [Alteromonas sp. a30]|uniref:sigma D regulator n=1 Tax=Alteromonas sp. a30 TaxID=2730917 RepID=UPI00227E42B1|nr:sigma D regulator [Alteromonas sp. a30]MCY7294738.1 sigma D regulator [Alteromonas sp. a30]